MYRNRRRVPDSASKPVLYDSTEKWLGKTGYIDFMGTGGNFTALRGSQ